MKFVLFPKSLKNWVPFGMGAALAYWMERQSWFEEKKTLFASMIPGYFNLTAPGGYATPLSRLVNAIVGGLIRIAVGGIIMVVGRFIKFRGNSMVRWFGQGVITAATIDMIIDGVTGYFKEIKTPPSPGPGPQPE